MVVALWHHTKAENTKESNKQPRKKKKGSTTTMTKRQKRLTGAAGLKLGAALEAHLVVGLLEVVGLGRQVDVLDRGRILGARERRLLARVEADAAAHAVVVVGPDIAVCERAGEEGGTGAWKRDLVFVCLFCLFCLFV